MSCTKCYLLMQEMELKQKVREAEKNKADSAERLEFIRHLISVLDRNTTPSIECPEGSLNKCPSRHFTRNGQEVR